MARLFQNPIQASNERLRVGIVRAAPVVHVVHEVHVLCARRGVRTTRRGLRETVLGVLRVLRVLRVVLRVLGERRKLTKAQLLFGTPYIVVPRNLRRLVLCCIETKFCDQMLDGIAISSNLN